MISVIIPCFKCHTSFEEDMQYLKDNITKSGLSIRVVVVDDGSEQADRILKTCLNLGFQYLRLKSNMGKGYAVRYGVKHSKAQHILYTDADIPYDFENVLKACSLILSGTVDLVIGDRTLKESKFYSMMPFVRNVGSKLFSAFVRAIAIRGFGDTQCGLKAISAASAQEIFKNIRTSGFAFDVEILRKAKKRNLKIEKIPVKFRKREMSSVTLGKAIRTCLDVIIIALSKY